MRISKHAYHYYVKVQKKSKVKKSQNLSLGQNLSSACSTFFIFVDFY